MRLRRRKVPRIDGPSEGLEPPVDEDGTQDGPLEGDGPVIDMEGLGDGTYGKRRGLFHRKPKIATVTLETMTYEDGIYVIRRRTVPERDAPRESVHVTGEKGKRFLDMVDRDGRDDLKFEYDPQFKRPDAIDLDLYAVNNDIPDALMMEQRPPKMDLKKLIMYGIIAVVGICVAYPFIVDAMS